MANQLRTPASRWSPLWGVACAVALLLGLVDSLSVMPHLWPLGVGRFLWGLGLILLVSMATGLVVPVILGIPASVAWLTAQVAGRGPIGSWFVAAPFALPLAYVGIDAVHSLTSGPWIRDRSWVVLVRAVMDILGVLVPWWIARRITIRWHIVARDWIERPSRMRQVFWTASAAGMILGLVWMDTNLLPRLYPAFHALLFLGMVVVAVSVGVVLSGSIHAFFGARCRWAFLLVGMVGLALSNLQLLPGENQFSRVVLLEKAPMASRILASLARAEEDPPPGPVTPEMLSLVSGHPTRRDSGGRSFRNVVLFTLDTIRADHVSHLGYDRATTPHLDALASEGSTFERAYAQYPSSQLSMASMFTGRYPTATEVHRIRGKDNRVDRRPTEAVLPGVLSGAGWDTVAATAFSEEFLGGLFTHVPTGFGRFNPYPHKVLLTADVVANHALDILEELGERPFFLWVHLFDPHDPYVSHPGQGFGTEPMDRYDGEIVHADRQMGRVLAALKARSDWEDTVVMVHSDHGEEFYEHGGRFHHSSLYDEQVRVPLVVRIPGLVKNQRISRPTELVDIMPTVLDLVGIDIPPSVQGHSLVPLLRGEEKNLPPPVAFMQFRETHIANARLDAVVFNGRKLIHNLNARTFHLFDMERDPGEQDDLVLQDSSELARMREVLDACRAFAGQDHGGDITTGESPDSDLAARVRSPEPGERLEAIATLHERGRTDLVFEALLESLGSEYDDVQRFHALDIMGMHRYVLAAPRVAELLDASEIPNVRVHAARALGAIGDRRWAPRLREILPEAGRAVQGAALVGLGLLGDTSPMVRSNLEKLFTTQRGDARMLTLGALSVVGDEAVHQALCDAVGTGVLPWHFDILFVEVVGRRKASRPLGAWYGRMLSQEPGTLMMGSLLDAVENFDPTDIAPVLRQAYGHRDATIRERVGKIARSLGKPAWPGAFQKINSGLESAREQGRHGKFSAAGRATMALLGTASGAEIDDWGLLLEAWSWFVRGGDLAAANQVTVDSGGTMSSAWSRDLRGKLAAILESWRVNPGRNGEIALKAPFKEKVLPSGGALVPVSVELTTDRGLAGMLAGGPVLRARVSNAAGGVVFGRDFPMPAQGILPEEKRWLVLPMVLPRLQPGEYRVEITLLGREGPLCPPVIWKASCPKPR